MNIALLKSKMVLKNITIQDLADALNIDRATLYRKMNGISDFYRNEIIIISKMLNLTNDEIMEIFFND